MYYLQPITENFKALAAEAAGAALSQAKNNSKSSLNDGGTTDHVASTSSGMKAVSVDGLLRPSSDMILHMLVSFVYSLLMVADAWWLLVVFT